MERIDVWTNNLWFMIIHFPQKRHCADPFPCNGVEGSDWGPISSSLSFSVSLDLLFITPDSGSVWTILRPSSSSSEASPTFPPSLQPPLPLPGGSGSMNSPSPSSSSSPSPPLLSYSLLHTPRHCLIIPCTLLLSKQLLAILGLLLYSCSAQPWLPYIFQKVIYALHTGLWLWYACWWWNSKTLCPMSSATR